MVAKDRGACKAVKGGAGNAARAIISKQIGAVHAFREVQFIFPIIFVCTIIGGCGGE